MATSIETLLSKPAASLTAEDLAGWNDPAPFKAAAMAAYARAYSSPGQEARAATDQLRFHLGGQIGALERAAEVSPPAAWCPFHHRDNLVRQRMRLWAWAARGFDAITRAAAAGGQLPVGSEPLPSQEPPRPRAPEPARFDLAAWAMARADVLCDPAKVRVVGDELRVRSGVLSAEELGVAYDHVAALIGWLMGQFVAVRPVQHETAGSDHALRATLRDSSITALARAA